MALTVGTQLGSHEITALLGKGGMGEVYRARDLKLKREVAIKILPEELARDADRVSRFQREAEVLASLNHPNIAAIHDLEETGGTRYLVLELVEGESLADRIGRGPIPVEEALDIAIQICEALEAAHERGVIHRDLKPANVKLTPEGKVKVLDFGLAKAYERESPDVSRSNSPTLNIAATNAGVILGTPAYMSPEQAVGRQVDRRADIWSFGVVLWEMLTGKTLFTGDTMAHILANVINREIDFGNLQDRPPARIRELLKRCLDRDVKTRLQVIGEARIALERYLVNPGAESVAVPAAQAIAKSGTLASKVPWIIATAVFALAAASALWTLWRAAPPGNQSLVRLNLDLPGYFGEINGAGFALSPDGSRIVYMQRLDSGRPILVTRLLAESEFTVLRGTEGAQGPFFSPDGQWIGFTADGRLQKVSVRGGSPVTLTTSSGIGSATWGKDGSIMASLDYGAPLSRIPDTGGTAPQEVVGRSEAGGVLAFPQYLPGGNSVLFAAGLANAPGIYAKNFSTGKVQRLIENSQFARYLPTGESKGHLVYVDQGTLFARPFDPGKLELLGPPQPVLSDIAQDSDGANTAIAFSDTGESLYRIGHAGAQTWPVQWMDGDGKTSVLLASPRSYSHPRFSPDREGRFLALVDRDQTNVSRVIVYDWKNDISVNLNKQGESRTFPVWSPDGQHLAMNNPKGIVWMRSDGAGEPHQILESKNDLLPASISPDGRFIAYSEDDPKTMWDIWVAPLDLHNPDQPVAGKPELVLRTPGVDFFPVFSPDGKWLAYFSDESGQYQVYVQPFPGPGSAQPVSDGMGGYPMWSNNGHELWFTGLDTVKVVDYRVDGNAFLASPPRVWNKAPYRLLGASLAWALHPDGKRIAMFPPEQADNKQAAPRFGFLLNFFDEVKRLAPVK